MKSLAYIFLIVCSMALVAGCSLKSRVRGLGRSCTVTKLNTVATITCPDGTVTTLTDGSNGTNGVNGVDGINGQDGATGPQGVAGNDGTNGQDGLNGQDGTNGTNGHSIAFSVTSADASLCVNGGSVISMGVDQNDNTTLDLSETSQIAVVCNGLNGTNGTNGTNGQDGTNGANAPPTAFTPVALVNPCGDAPGIYDEVFLQLSNGTLLASFSDNANGSNTRFSILTPGSYVTTDGDSCAFTVNSLGQITNENHHY